MLWIHPRISQPNERCLEEVVEEQNKLNVKTSKNIESLVNILEQKNGIQDPIIKSALEGVGYYDK